jgi:hypothetical protein
MSGAEFPTGWCGQSPPDPNGCDSDVRARLYKQMGALSNFKGLEPHVASMNDLPIEVVFDRALRECKTRYSGRQDPEKLDPPYRQLACDLRDHMNRVYETQFDRVEGSGARVLYFDFIDSSSTNAIAFRRDEYAFIGVTAGFLNRANEVCYAICHDPTAIPALGLSPSDEAYAVRIFTVLFSILLQFVAAHELGHHFHGHVGYASVQGRSVLEEMADPNAPGETRAENCHVAEIEADGYAVKVVLTNASQNGPKIAIASLLGCILSDPALDGIIERLFLAAVIGYFHVLPQPSFTPDTVGTLSHPPRLVRLNFLIRGVQAWRAETKHRNAEWPTDREFAEFGTSIARALDPVAGVTWEEQSSFVLSEAGKQYIQRIGNSTALLREKMKDFQWRLKS